MMRRSDIEFAKPLKNREQSSLLQAFLLIWVCSSVQADYQAGLDAYHSGEFSVALAEWKAEVNQPEPVENLAIYRESLYGIAMLFWQGDGVEQDYNISAVWMKQAADINHPGALVKLGFLYTMGQGVPQNFEQAARCFQMAADQGNADAIHNLNLLHQKGLVSGPSVAPDTVMPGAGESPELIPPLSSESEMPIVASVSTAPAISVLDRSENWILTQEPGHYTIQVIALSHPEKLHAFIAQNPEWEPFAIYRQTRYEQPLWVLVQGDYAEVEAARAAVQGFPAGLQKREELWIRRFEMIQGLIE